MSSVEVITNGKKHFINNYKQFDLVLDHGEDCYLVDRDGKKYLDFVAGIAVNALGYSNTVLKEALKEQIDQLLHCSNLYWNENAVSAASMLTESSRLKKVFFCNSGAEANEAALKLARKYSKKFVGKERFEIISMTNSFHGRTMGAITATGQEKYQKDLDPLLPGVVYAEYNNINDLKNKINPQTCAIMLELIQGEGGIVSADFDYVKEVRELCDKHKIVLIIDEVQTGIGRTGNIYAYEHYGIKPDIVSLAKGLGAGVPVGAIIASEEVAKGFEPGDHASTFGGNPLVTAAINVVFHQLIFEGILEHVKEQGDYLTQKLMELKDKYDAIEDLRGIGLIQGVAIKEISVSDIIEECMENGLLLVGAGKDVIRFVPPLVITKEDIDKAMVIFDESIEKVIKKNR